MYVRVRFFNAYSFILSLRRNRFRALSYDVIIAIPSGSFNSVIQGSALVWTYFLFSIYAPCTYECPGGFFVLGIFYYLDRKMVCMVALFTLILGV